MPLELDQEAVFEMEHLSRVLGDGCLYPKRSRNEAV